MPESDSDHLAHLLTTFRVTWLGEGDTNAGANLLVGMAVTLANLAERHSGIASSQRHYRGLGTHLLASGELTPGLIQEQISRPLAHLQNVFVEQLRNILASQSKETSKSTPNEIDLSAPPSNNPGAEALLELFTEESSEFIPLVDRTTLWRTVLGDPPGTCAADLANHPKFVLFPKSDRTLEHDLAHLHDQQSLVVVGLHQSADAGRYGTICNCLLDGPYPVGEFGETINAQLLVTDSSGVLRHIATHPTEKSGWLGRLICLVDGDTGPDAREDHPAPGQIHVEDMARRFHMALTRTLAQRFDRGYTRALVYKLELGQAQMAWMAFLKGMEPRLPGISGMARGFLASLAFGLVELGQAPDCESRTVAVKEVEALARWVIRRMANWRAALLGNSRTRHRQQQAARIMDLLKQEKLCERDLYRKRGLPAAECRAILSELSRAGLVEQVGDLWAPADQAHQFDEKQEHLFIEV